MFELLAEIELGSFLFAITCVLLVMVFAFMVIFFITYSRNMGIQRKMKEMKDNHQDHINASNLKTLEAERQRFAEDLHDEIGASLSAIRLYVSNIDSKLPSGELKDQLTVVKHTIDQSMASTRRISHNILPPGLELMGLSFIVADLVKQVNESGQLKVDIQVLVDMPKLQLEKELILYRVLQELLNNTMKHAAASLVAIDFTVEHSKYIIRYKDNGNGFDDTNLKYTGLGLSNIESRIKLVGGSYQLKTAPQEGFDLLIEVPIIEQ